MTPAHCTQDKARGELVVMLQRGNAGMSGSQVLGYLGNLTGAQAGQVGQPRLAVPPQPRVSPPFWPPYTPDRVIAPLCLPQEPLTRAGLVELMGHAPHRDKIPVIWRSSTEYKELNLLVGQLGALRQVSLGEAARSGEYEKQLDLVIEAAGRYRRRHGGNIAKEEAADNVVANATVEKRALARIREDPALPWAGKHMTLERAISCKMRNMNLIDDLVSDDIRRQVEDLDRQFEGLLENKLRDVSRDDFTRYTAAMDKLIKSTELYRDKDSADNCKKGAATDLIEYAKSHIDAIRYIQKESKSYSHVGNIMSVREDIDCAMSGHTVAEMMVRDVENRRWKLETLESAKLPKKNVSEFADFVHSGIEGLMLALDVCLNMELENKIDGRYMELMLLE